MISASFVHSLSTGLIVKDTYNFKEIIWDFFKNIFSLNVSATKPPSIETCHTVMIGQNGEKKRAMSRTSSTKCHDLTDFYGNFQPVTVSSTIFTEYTIDVTSLVKPSFIKESNFGVTDISLKLNIKELSGKKFGIISAIICRCIGPGIFYGIFI